MTKDPYGRVVVVGVGNTLLMDEGAGPHVVDHLKGTYGYLANVDWLDGGTIGLALFDRVASADTLVIVDAAELHAAPGVVEVFEAVQMDRFIGREKRSVHELGIAEVLDAARLLGKIPANRALVAIQGVEFSWGDGLSPAVVRAIPMASAAVIRLLCGWGVPLESQLRDTEAVRLDGGK